VEWWKLNERNFSNMGWLVRLETWNNPSLIVDRGFELGIDPAGLWPDGRESHETTFDVLTELILC
jgi:hypothetical protein